MKVKFLVKRSKLKTQEKVTSANQYTGNKVANDGHGNVGQQDCGKRSG